MKITEQTTSLEILEGLLGQPVFIPVEYGGKSPLLKEWQNRTRRDTTDLGYRVRLQGQNVAVLTGEPSGHLVAVDCDDDDYMAAFLELNRDLCSQTLQIKASRGRHFWFRISGDYPRGISNVKTREGKGVGELRAGNGCTIVAGRHPGGLDYHVLNERPVLEISFDQLTWPEGYIHPWLTKGPTEDPGIVEIAGKVGDAWACVGKGGIQINVQFFAELVKLKREVVFEEAENSFFLYSHQTGTWDGVTESRMQEEAWLVCREFIGKQDEEVAEQLKLRFTQKTRADIVSMLKSKVAIRGFFQSGPCHASRDKRFHLKDGVKLAFGGGDSGWLYFDTGFSPSHRSRSSFSWRHQPSPVTPLFDQLLASMFGVENVADAMKFLGYLLIDGNPGQHIQVIKGPARSGKSQLAILLKGILGNAGWAQLRTSQLDGRFEVGGFVGKRIVYGPDVRKDFFCVEGARNLKALTGGDPLEVEMKYSNKRIAVQGDFHVLVTTNDVLRLAAGEDAGAWARRLIIMETRAANVDELIPNLGERILAEEGDGVFSKLLEAALLARAELDEKGKLEVPEKYRLGGSEAVILVGDIDLWVSSCVGEGSSNFATTDLYQHYSRWCAGRGETPVKDAVFARRLPDLLEDRGISASHSVSRDGRHVNGYRGLGVLS